MNPRFDLLTLQLLRQVGETGSVARAAETLHLTASAGSKRILELESQLGVTLLARRPDGARLTAAGSLAVARAEQVLAELHALRGELAPYVSGHAGNLCVASNTSGLCAKLAVQLAGFSAQYPQIRISVMEATSAAVVDAVTSGTADIGVASSSAPSRGLSCHSYTKTPLVLAVPEGHPLAGRAHVAYAETLVYPHISRAPGSALAHFPETPPAPADDGLPPGITTSVTSFPAVFALVAAGLGVAVIPLAPVITQAPQDIVLVPLSDAWADFELRLLVDPGAAPSPAVSLLLSWLQAT